MGVWGEYGRTSYGVYLSDYYMILAAKYHRQVFNEGVFKYLKRKLLEIYGPYPQIFILA